jgi:uncharacterized protein (TIGR00730 family)
MTNNNRIPSLPKLPSAIDWERQWQKRWSKARAFTYELPADPDQAERELLNQTRSPAKEKARLKRINDEFERAFKTLYRVGPAVTVFGSARFKQTHPYYKLAHAVGSELAAAGFATMTGGGPGIMEAANRGAHEAGGASYGLNIILPHEQDGNPYVDKSIEFRYFFTRKVCLVKYSCAFIVMPGGLGTLDELFEAATLIQCGKIGPFPLILIGEKFWNGMRNWFQFMMAEGVFARDEIGFGHVTDSPKEAVELIVRGLHPSVRACLKPSKSIPPQKRKTS